METKLQEKLGNRVQSSKDISAYFTMKTKTVAEYFFAAETREELIMAIKTAHELQLPLLMVGGGSNIAVLKDFIPGLVVRNMYQKKEVVKETNEYKDVLISGGYPVSRLSLETARDGVEGLEFHFGLPGTLGGGIAMNSKWVAAMNHEGTFPKYMGDPLISAVVITQDGTLKEVEQSYFKFAYDYSILKDTGEIFLEGRFRLLKNDPILLERRAKEAMEYRKKTQVVGQPTCGCMFQNISEEMKLSHNLPTTSAGYLVDQCGLKNYKVGDFIVSDKHANFIINTGKGDPADLKKLVETIRGKVKEKFDIELEEEVILLN